MNKPNIKKFGINAENFDNTKELQNFTSKQIYTKGFSFNTQANTVNEFPILLGGKARKLHGITLFFGVQNQAEEDLIGLVINQEQIVNDVIWWAYNPQGPIGNIHKGEQFFGLPRNLSGQDSTQFSVKSLNAHKVYITFYLSDL